MWFSRENFVLIVAQAACVALPAAGLPAWTERFRDARLGARAAAVDRGGHRARSSSCPRPRTCSPGWRCCSSRRVARLRSGGRRTAPGPRSLLLAAPLLALAWASPDTRAGQLATTVLIAGSAVTVGRLLAGAAPLSLLKVGVVAMAAVDAYLVFSDQLQAPERGARRGVAGSGAAAAAVSVLRRCRPGLRRLLRGRGRRRDPRRRARTAARGRRRPRRRLAVLGPALPRLRRAPGDDPTGDRAPRGNGVARADPAGRSPRRRLAARITGGPC